MDLTLYRYDVSPSGVFGYLMRPDGVSVCETLEHNFDGKALVPPGKYRCVRGLHRLKVNGPEFETFEVMGVTGHWGILFHVGNFNKDSRGCILVGDAFDERDPNNESDDMLIGSRTAFKRFMEYQANCAEFTLHVLE